MLMYRFIPPLIASFAFTSAALSAPAPSHHYRDEWMGQMSCEAWPKTKSYDELEKSAALNWVLGFISRASRADAKNLFESGSQSAVSGWIDTYCQTNPRSDVVSAAFVLEGELKKSGPLAKPKPQPGAVKEP
jgi:hypothetical protein